MDSMFEQMMAQLQETRANKNMDFYDEHNNNYYKHKGKSQLKRDQKQTSVALIKSHKEQHLVDQAHDRVYGKATQDFNVDKKMLRKSTKKPLDFVEAEVARMQNQK